MAPPLPPPIGVHADATAAGQEAAAGGGGAVVVTIPPSPPAPAPPLPPPPPPAQPDAWTASAGDLSLHKAGGAVAALAGGGAAAAPPAPAPAPAATAAAAAHPPPPPAPSPDDWTDALLREMGGDVGHRADDGATPGWVRTALAAARRHAASWVVAAAGAAGAAAAGAAAPTATFLTVPLWRWALLPAVLPLLHLAASATTAALLAAADGSLVRTRGAALFLVVGVRAPVTRAARAGLTAAAFAALTADWGGGGDGDGRGPRRPPVLDTAAALLACAFVFAGVRLGTRLAAAAAAAAYHERAGHAARIDGALAAEYALWALSQPPSYPPSRHGSEGGEPQPPPPPPSPPSTQPLLAPLPPPPPPRAATLAPARLVRAVRAMRRRSSAARTHAAAAAAAGVADPPPPPARLGSGGGRGPVPPPPPPPPPPPARSARALAALERHVRETRLRLPLADALGRGGVPATAAASSTAAVAAAGGSALGGRVVAPAGPPPPPPAGGPPAAAPGSDAREARLHALYLFWHVREAGLRSTTGAAGAGAAATATTPAAVPPPPRPYLIPSDLAPFFPPGDAAAAAAAWRLLDADGDGRASAADVRDAVLAVQAERDRLAATLSGARAAAASLERVVGLALHTGATLAYAALLGWDVGRAWVTLSSVIVALAFIFSDAARTAFTAAIFVFAVHPFDIGDVLLLPDGGGSAAGPATPPVWHRVESIALLHTTVQRWDGVRLAVPNAALAASPLANVSRSAPRWEGFKVLVDVATPAAAFEAVDAAVTAHVARHPAEFSGEKLVVAGVAGDPLKITLAVWFEYAQAGHDLGRLSRARSGLHLAVCAALVGAGVAYSLPPFGGGVVGGGGGEGVAAATAAAIAARGGNLGGLGGGMGLVGGAGV